MKTQQSIWQHWNQQSAWMQFRHMQRVLFGVALLIFGLALVTATPNSGTYAQVLLKFPTFQLQAFIVFTVACALLIIGWWRAGFWTLFLLASPLHFWTAFTFQGVVVGAFGGWGLVVYLWVEAQAFLSLWVAQRRERGQPLWTR